MRIPQQHVNELEQGKVSEWNQWWTRQIDEDKVPHTRTGTELVGIDLSGVDLTGADLRRLNLRDAKFHEKSGKEIKESFLAHARLSNCDLTNATFKDADLHGASFRHSTLTNATFKGCNLRHANFTAAKVGDARFINCDAYGAGLWNTTGDPKKVTLRLSATKADREHKDTRAEEDFVVATHLESAAFLYLLADNERISAAFDGLTEKVVLILGSFKNGGKARLQDMKHQLRGQYAPILFDFPPPGCRSLTETIGALAHMSYFVIADLTNASSVPQELSHIVPFLPSVPIVPVLCDSQPYSMFEHWLRYSWVADPVWYGVNDFETFLKDKFQTEVVNKAKRLRERLRKIESRRLESCKAKPVKI
jgi:hypothetical protein